MFQREAEMLEREAALRRHAGQQQRKHRPRHHQEQQPSRPSRTPFHECAPQTGTTTQRQGAVPASGSAERERAIGIEHRAHDVTRDAHVHLDGVAQELELDDLPAEDVDP